ncbi:MAG: DNA polymerase III subunit gamma/tau [Nitrospirota bacterium]
MQFQVSARLWRPKTFEEVVGQQHLIRILKNAVSGEKAAQAYLFSGIRGVGKTSVARILAKAINCTSTENPPCNACSSCSEIIANRSVDVIEIDGASNTHVEDVHHLREKVQYLPLSGKYKVYIIDEVHMLSNAAFNALLKTLEEPPSHLVFILATTEAHKIPTTILSRCQHLIFRRVKRVEIETQLRKILLQENKEMPDHVLTFITKASEGSLRDALSLFDQVMTYAKDHMSEEDISILFGRAAENTFHALIAAMSDKNAEALLSLAREIENNGYDLRQFLTDWIEHLRHLIVMKNVKSADHLIDLPDEEKREIEKESALFSHEVLQSFFSIFIRLQEDIRNAPRPHLLLEVALMRAILIADLTPIEQVIAEIQGMTNPVVGAKNFSPKETSLPHDYTKPTRNMPLPVQTTLSPPRSETKSFLSPRPSEIATTSLPNDGAKGFSPLQNDADLWKALLQEVKKARPNLASYLDQGALQKVEEKTIQLQFSEESSFLISLIEKEENKKVLAPLLKNYFKRDLELDLRASILERVPVAGMEQDNLFVKEALKIFSGATIK